MRFKMNFNIEDVAAHVRWRAKVNGADLRDLAFFRGGEEIPVSDKEIDDWRFTGLSNIDFVMERLHGDQHD